MSKYLKLALILGAFALVNVAAPAAAEEAAKTEAAAPAAKTDAAAPAADAKKEEKKCEKVGADGKVTMEACPEEKKEEKTEGAAAPAATEE